MYILSRHPSAMNHGLLQMIPGGQTDGRGRGRATGRAGEGRTRQKRKRTDGRGPHRSCHGSKIYFLRAETTKPTNVRNVCTYDDVCTGPGEGERVPKEYGYTNQEEYSRFFSVSIGHLATLATVLVLFGGIFKMKSQFWMLSV